MALSRAPRDAALSERSRERAPGADTARGLDAFDRARALSLADEGGAAGAHVDTQRPAELRPPGPETRPDGERAPTASESDTPALDEGETPPKPTRVRRGNGAVE